MGEEDLTERVQKRRRATGGEGVWDRRYGLCQEGTARSWVERQYYGRWARWQLQIAVTCCDNDRSTCPVAVRLYLNQAWAAKAERRAKRVCREDPSRTSRDRLARWRGAGWVCPSLCGGRCRRGDHQLHGGHGGAAEPLSWRTNRLRVSRQRKAMGSVQRADACPSLDSLAMRTILAAGTQVWLRKS